MNKYVICYPQTGGDWYQKEHNCIKLHAHEIAELVNNDEMDTSKKLILLLRDYKDCIYQHAITVLDNPSNKCLLSELDNCWLTLIEYYYQWEGEKEVVYYEDIDKLPQVKAACHHSVGDRLDDGVVRWLMTLNIPEAGKIIRRYLNRG